MNWVYIWPFSISFNRRSNQLSNSNFLVLHFTYKCDQNQFFIHKSCYEIMQISCVYLRNVKFIEYLFAPNKLIFILVLRVILYTCKQI